MRIFSTLSRKARVTLLIGATFVLSFTVAIIGRAATQLSEKMWQDAGGRVLDPAAERLIDPSAHRIVRLDTAALTQALERAPMEFSQEATERPAIIHLPMPDGTMARFRFEESPIMEPALARRHPELKTYSGQGMDDPAATARFDWTPLGLHAIILSGAGAAFIEPVSSSDTTTYVTYFDHDASMDRLSFSCLVSEAEMAEAEQRGVSLNQGGVSPAFVTGSTLRTYRLAVAATGEFTQQYGGGDVNTALARITTLINQVNALYRTEATITFQLIANETSIIFTDPATDGYTNDSLSTMLTENQNKLTTVIGSANYDIGHVFGGITVGQGSVAFSGLAAAGVCNSGGKARGGSTMGGASGTSFPHSIFLRGVTHEIGHQFSARHTFNSTTGGCSGNRDGAGAYEPGSGSTIMGYSNCGADTLQNSPDFYFHTGSLEQIVTWAAGTGNCAAMTATGNGAPSITALSNFTIPANTPFTLTGSVTDPNGDALTCVWEEFDLGAVAPPHSDDGTRPLFRSFLPAAGTARTFPSLQYILNNANVPPPTTGGFLTGEVLPSTTRTMNFRFTARDNRAAGGGTANAPMQVGVVSTAGPFAVTVPNTAISWPGNSAQLVTWSVANTAGAPINCANVSISLSTDGGNTFPFTLTASTPNDGSETISVPGTPTTAARIKVEAVGNVFFDISNTNFSITGAGSSPSPTPTSTPGSTPAALGNISTRLRVETGDNVLIGGFIIAGTQPKSVIVRALGPSLTALGVTGALTNPTLELRDASGALLFSNNDWQENAAQASLITAAGLAPGNSLEPAIATTLPANNASYTAIVRGFNNATGIGVVEAYDLDRTVDSKLANISTRGFVSTGDNVMIGGLIVVGTGPANVLIRAIGPSLANFGVPNALPDPTLELRDGNGTLVAFNDDWRTDQQTLINGTDLAPADDLESAILRSLSPGPYTAIVREYNNFTGVALVEAYQLP
jgi:hypothetical protein